MGKYYPKGSSQYDALMNKAVDLVWAIVLRDIDPREGCRQVGEICESLGWPEELLELGSIAPELQRLEANGLPTESLTDDIIKQAEALFPDFLHARHDRKEEDLTREAVLLSRWILEGRTEPRKGCKLIGGICSELWWPEELAEFGSLEEMQWEEWPETRKPRKWNKTIMNEARKLVDWYENKRKSGEKP